MKLYNLTPYKNCRIVANNEDVGVPVKDLIPIIATPVEKGEWIEDGYFDVPNACSKCGGENDRKTNYCPHCGAKMRIEQDQEKRELRPFLIDAKPIFRAMHGILISKNGVNSAPRPIKDTSRKDCYRALWLIQEYLDLRSYDLRISPSYYHPYPRRDWDDILPLTEIDVKQKLEKVEKGIEKGILEDIAEMEELKNE